MLFFAGIDVLPTYAVYGTGSITAAGVNAVKAAWRLRLERLFEEAPIPFRRQNGGDYPDSHVLANHVAVGQTGLLAHIAEEHDTLEALTWSEDHHDANAATERHRDRRQPVSRGDCPSGATYLALSRGSEFDVVNLGRFSSHSGFRTGFFCERKIYFHANSRG